MSRLWILPVLGLIATLGFACRNQGDDLPTSGSATPVASASLTISVTPTSSTAVPADWLTYTDSDGRFTVRYPPDWLNVAEHQFSSKKLRMPGDSFVESIVVEFNVNAYDGYGCGVLRYDSATGQVSPQPGATAAFLGGLPAWEIVREPGDPALNEYTRIQAVSLIYNGYCFNVAAYFTQQNPDLGVFPQIRDSFQFTF